MLHVYSIESGMHRTDSSKVIQKRVQEIAQIELMRRLGLPDEFQAVPLTVSIVSTSAQLPSIEVSINDRVTRFVFGSMQEGSLSEERAASMYGMSICPVVTAPLVRVNRGALSESATFTAAEDATWNAIGFVDPIADLSRSDAYAPNDPSRVICWFALTEERNVLAGEVVEVGLWELL